MKKKGNCLFTRISKRIILIVFFHFVPNVWVCIECEMFENTQFLKKSID